MKKYLTNSLMVMTLIGAQSPAFAENYYPILTYTCDPAGDVIKIKHEAKWGDDGKNFPFSEQQGTYNPWHWVEIESRDGLQLVSKTQTVELSCQLSNGIYKVVLEPKIYNSNYLATCGNKISAKVTVFRGGAILLDKKELEPFCVGNSPVIRGIKVFGKEGRVKVYKIARHKFY